MSDAPKVFIVILNWNGKERLLACLRSVFFLAYGNYEVVVVDNASRDGSLEEAKTLFSRAHFILNSDNLGFAAGMNIGIRFALSRGAEYVWILNNDAECRKDTLSTLVSVALTYGPRALFSPRILNSDGSEWFSGGKVDYIRMRTAHVAAPEVRAGITSYQTGYLTGCALFIPRQILEVTGLLDEEYFLYYEDADYSLRAKKNGFGLRVVPGAVVIHGEQSVGSKEKPYWLVRSGLRFFAAHTPPLLRPWIWVYVRLRRLKNVLDSLRGMKEAAPVSSAYADFRAS
ncbi:MAG TPA: glycosyltransferase family 2 protein [Candidatus Fimivivens sp.]|nr:glycosyltransferase family 2 protein [Candidatus Fimivivens sp.]